MKNITNQFLSEFENAIFGEAKKLKEVYDLLKKMDEISFSAETPEKAKYFLDNYISEVNVNVINKNVRELELLRKKINDDLTSEANMIDKSVKQEWQRKNQAKESVSGLCADQHGHER